MNQNKSMLVMLVAIAAISAVEATRRPRNVSIGRRPTCEMCEFAVKGIQVMVRDQRVVRRIERRMDLVCEFFRVFGLYQPCKESVNNYIDEVIEQIHDIDPLDICQDIRMCSDDQVVAARAQQEVAPTAALGPIKSDDDMCERCIDIMKKLSDYAKAEDYTNLMKLLQEVRVKHENQSVNQTACPAIASLFRGNIVKIIREMKSPEEFCKHQISLC